VGTDRPTLQAGVPRWFGYLNLLLGFLLIAGTFVYLVKTGPLAWNGLLAFWIPSMVYVVCKIATPIVLLNAINSETAELAEGRMAMVYPQGETGQMHRDGMGKLVCADVWPTRRTPSPTDPVCVAMSSTDRRKVNGQCQDEWKARSLSLREQHADRDGRMRSALRRRALTSSLSTRASLSPTHRLPAEVNILR
jgi:hypothetical protein